MSFSTPKWEKDQSGDQTRTNLFKKSPKKKSQKQQQQKKQSSAMIEQDSNTNTRNVPKPLKRKQEVLNKDVNSTNENKRRKIVESRKTRLKRKRAIPQSVDIRKTVKPFKLKDDCKFTRNALKQRENEDEEEYGEVLNAKKMKNKLKKKLKRLKNNASAENKTQTTNSKPFGLNVELLKNKLSDALKPPKPKEEPLSLRDRMLERLRASRFRYLNEQLYTSESKDAQKLFQNDPYAFEAYHEGYKQQVSKWPLNPVDHIIESIKNMSTKHVIADFGCGEAKIAQTVPNKVHSFDLVSTNKFVTACDMAHCPLKKSSVDIAIFCLSLMGTNLKDYLIEANRVLKTGGILKIADVESRFEKVDLFIEGLSKYGFKNTSKDLSNNMFYFLDFKKEKDIKNKNKLPTIGLFPCMYKKR